MSADILQHLTNCCFIIIIIIIIIVVLIPTHCHELKQSTDHCGGSWHLIMVLNKLPIAQHVKHASELRHATCSNCSYSVTSHPTQVNPNQ